ncbi:MAG: hydrogenase expression/formation protein [Rubrivivax sp.]|nr:hydrogenase expression/formation protein [Rubrivivax sp.]
MKPFPVPVVAFGPGSQPEDEGLDYMTMPAGMETYRPPSVPEPEELAGRRGAVRVLHEVLEALRRAEAGEGAAPVVLRGLSAEELALVNQVLGEGDVSAQVQSVAGQGMVTVQESVFAGIWRVLETTADGVTQDRIEVGAIPTVLARAAQEDAVAPRPAPGPAPGAVMNAPALLLELADARARWQPGDATHMVNLTLLPVTPEDIAWLDHVLGTGRVVILSRGYGNCRITNCAVANTWRLVYYNSQDKVILNTVEVSGVPEVACAAPEDLHDSLDRLAEVLAWVDGG